MRIVGPYVERPSLIPPGIEGEWLGARMGRDRASAKRSDRAAGRYVTMVGLEPVPTLTRAFAATIYR
jgi:hypothetical protein